MYRVAVLGRDGIGDDVLDSCISVLNNVTDKIEFIELKGGYEIYQQRGVPISKYKIDEIQEMDAVLFGATETPSKETKYKSLILTLRQELELYANLRIVPNMNKGKKVFIVRENCEGLYSDEYECSKNKIIDNRVITREGCERITKFAAELASKIGTDKITFVHKANVLKGDKFFREITMNLAENKGLRIDDRIIDAFTIEVVESFWEHDIILSGNLFGDIISDLSSINVESLGIIPSGNYGDEIALFEPVHGTAPDIEEKGIANPIGSILSGGMMLNYLGLNGDLVWTAVKEQISQGSLTPDIGGRANTEEVTQEIISKINKISDSNEKSKGGDKNE